MDLGDLVAHSVEAVGSLNLDRQTVDSHVDEYLQSNRRAFGNEDDRVFLKQVVYGCSRYKAMCKIVVDSFLFKHAADAQRKDYNIFMVVAYLILVRLDDLGFPRFRQLCDTQGHQRMYFFLSFIFNKENVEKWFRNEWCKLYDPDWVDRLIFDLLDEGKRYNIYYYIDDLEEKTTGIKKKRSPRKALMSKKMGQGADDDSEAEEGGSPDINDDDKQVSFDRAKRASQATFKPTVVVPFNITKPRPRRVPNPQVISNEFKAKPAPKTTFKPSSDQKRLEEKKVEYRQKQSERQVLSPVLHTLSRPSNTKQLTEKARQQEEEKYKYIPPTVNPVPSWIRDNNAPVKLNAAAIAREDALFRKRQAKELEVLKKYESELRDDGEFEEWRQRMLMQDEVDAEAAIIQRRDLLKDVLAEEIRLKRDQAVELKRAQADCVRDELNEGFAKRRLLLEEQAKRTDARIQSIHEQREVLKDTMHDLKVKRQENAANLLADRQDINEKIKLERAKDMEEKKRVIMEIKAHDLVPIRAVPEFDETTTPDHRLLESMSLYELKERLKLLKERQAEEEASKRRDIIRDKEMKQEEMIRKVENISVVRGRIAQHNQKEKERRQKLQEEKKLKLERIREEQSLQLIKVLEKRRSERIHKHKKLVEDNKDIRNRLIFLGAEPHILEANKWQTQLEGQARKTRVAVGMEKREIQDARNSKIAEKAHRDQNRKRTEESRQAWFKDYSQRLARGAEETATMLDMEDEDRRKNVDAENHLKHIRRIQKSKLPTSVYLNSDAFGVQHSGDSAVNSHAGSITARESTHNDEALATARSVVTMPNMNSPVKLHDVEME